MFRRISLLILCGFLVLDTIAQTTARQEDLTFNTRKNRNLTVNHKSFSAIQINGTVTDSVAKVAIDLTGKTGTIGFKRQLNDTAFFASAPIVISDATGGKFTATFNSASWGLNITVKTRFFGDLLLSDFGAPLPSIDLWLHPNANQGDEVSYVAPSTAGFETNVILIAGINRVNFSNFVFVVKVIGSTQRLTIVGITPIEVDPVWSGESNLYYLVSNPSNFISSMELPSTNVIVLVNRNGVDQLITNAVNTLIDYTDAVRNDNASFNLTTSIGTFPLNGFYYLKNIVSIDADNGTQVTAIINTNGVLAMLRRIIPGATSVPSGAVDMYGSFTTNDTYSFRVQHASAGNEDYGGNLFESFGFMQLIHTE